MASYILLSLIFTTVFFILIFLTNITDIAVWIIYLVLSYLIYNGILNYCDSIPEYKTLVVSCTFVILFCTLIFLMYYKKDFFKLKVMVSLYIISSLAATYYGISNFKTDKALQDKIALDQIKKNEIINRYKFDVNSIKIKVTDTDYTFNKIDYPVIIYKQGNKKPYFDHHTNMLLDSYLIAYSLDSIKTIILIDYYTDTVGIYTNGRTTALTTNAKISFIDNKTMKLIYSTTLAGTPPSKQIRYNKYPPSFVMGHSPSDSNLTEKIKSKLSDQQENNLLFYK